MLNKRMQELVGALCGEQMPCGQGSQGLCSDPVAFSKRGNPSARAFLRENQVWSEGANVIARRR